MFSAASQIAEAELFFGAFYLYSFLFDIKFCFSHVTEESCNIKKLSTYFQFTFLPYIEHL